MAKRIKLEASPRTAIGGRNAKRTRKQGMVPAVIYGNGEPKAIQLTRAEIVKAVGTFAVDNALVDLEIKSEDGKANTVLTLIQDVQHDHLNDTILHVDFHEVSEKKKIRTEVHLESTGEPVGVKTGGGILDVVVRSVLIECLPKDMPSHIEVDISHLALGQSIHVKDIKAPEGVTIINDPELLLFIVHEPRVSSAEETAAAATASAAAATPAPAAGAKAAPAAAKAPPAK